MTNKERLLQALFGHEGREHIDVKFFKGAAPTISPDQIWDEGASAFFQIDNGLVDGDEEFFEDFKEIDVKLSL